MFWLRGAFSSIISMFIQHFVIFIVARNILFKTIIDLLKLTPPAWFMWIVSFFLDSWLSEWINVAWRTFRYLLIPFLDQALLFIDFFFFCQILSRFIQFAFQFESRFKSHRFHFGHSKTIGFIPDIEHCSNVRIEITYKMKNDRFKSNEIKLAKVV